MKLTKEHLKQIQIDLFYSQLNALKAEETELNEQFNIARNLACSEWDYGSVAASGGGRQGLRVARIIPGQMDLLRKNYESQRIEISYRRYALIKAYKSIIEIGGNLAECYDYWEKIKEL